MSQRQCERGCTPVRRTRLSGPGVIRTQIHDWRCVWGRAPENHSTSGFALLNVSQPFVFRYRVNDLQISAGLLETAEARFLVHVCRLRDGDFIAHCASQEIVFSQTTRVQSRARRSCGKRESRRFQFPGVRSQNPCEDEKRWKIC